MTIRRVVYSNIREIIPRIDRWAGKNTFRFRWLWQMLCWNGRTKTWFIGIKIGPHWWQASNTTALPFRYRRN